MAFDDTLFERRSIIRGMHVRAADGTLLGYVALIGQEHLYVRSSPFISHRHWKEVPVSAVGGLLHGDVVLKEGTGPLAKADPSFHGEIPTQTLPFTLATEEPHGSRPSEGEHSGAARVPEV